MKTTRLMTLLSAAAITGALMTPFAASAHGSHDRWDQHRGERWSESPSRYEKRHHWDRHHRNDARFHVDRPRRWSRPGHREPVVRYELGNGLTILYR